MPLHTHLITRIEGSLAAIGFLRDQIEAIAAAAEQVVATLTAETGTLYTAGNGGSAAQAMHLAEELIGRYRADRRSMRALCLNADSAALTCIANDFGYERVFARQCEALLTPRDLLLVLSTSGKSRNIIAALQAAQAARCPSIALLGKDGGDCLSLCDHAIVVPGGDSAHVQEAHQVVVHLLCEAVEQAMA